MSKLFAFMDGWKAYAGAVVQMLTGAGAVIAAAAAIITHFVDPSNPTGLGLDAGVTALLAGAYVFGKGLEAFGMAHKAEKQAAAIADQTQSIDDQTLEIKQQTAAVQEQTEVIAGKK